MRNLMTDKRGSKMIDRKILDYQGKVEECKFFQKVKGRPIMSVQILAHRKQATKCQPSLFSFVLAVLEVLD